MLNLVLKLHRANLKSDTTEAQKLFAMLKLIPESNVAQTRPSLAFALVIDTSGSMLEFADQEKAKEEMQRRGMGVENVSNKDGSFQGVNLTLPTKLDRAIEAAHALIDDNRLQPEDQVALIHFDDVASTLLPLTPLSNKQAAHVAIDSLRNFSGGTQMAKGMDNALKELGSLPTQVAKRVLLLTDGKTFDEPKCCPLAEQFATSNTPLVAIGIGAEYNADLMRQLADISQGRPYHLEEMSQLNEILNAEVGSSVKEVVTDLQASVSATKGVSLDGITRVYPSLAEVGTAEQPYRLGNIIAGDYTVFVLEFTISGFARPPSRARIAQVGLAGFAPGLARKFELEPNDLFVSFTNDEAAIAVVDPEVLGYVQQKNIDNMMQEAVRTATIDAGKARQTLQVARNMTVQLGNTAVTIMIDRALNELNSNGTISVNTGKTIGLGGRTKTIKTGATTPLDGNLPDEEIRRLTNT